MRNHIIPIILLLIAVIAFILRFFVTEEWQEYCDIAAFVLPTIAALIEIMVSEVKVKETDGKIKMLREKQLSVHFEGDTLVFEEGKD